MPVVERHKFMGVLCSRGHEARLREWLGDCADRVEWMPAAEAPRLDRLVASWRCQGAGAVVVDEEAAGAEEEARACVERLLATGEGLGDVVWVASAGRPASDRFLRGLEAEGAVVVPLRCLEGDPGLARTALRAAAMRAGRVPRLADWPAEEGGRGLLGRIASRLAARPAREVDDVMWVEPEAAAEAVDERVSEEAFLAAAARRWGGATFPTPGEADAAARAVPWEPTWSAGAAGLGPPAGEPRRTRPAYGPLPRAVPGEMRGTTLPGGPGGEEGR